VSPEIWAGHYGAPLDEREIARHYTLTSDDLEIVGRRRGDATRLGYALLMLYMRWPGRALEAGEVPPTPVLAYVAQQLGVAPAAFADYAHRDQTRREHLVEIRRSHGFRIFDRQAFRDVVAFSIPIAQTIIHPGQMAGVIVDELRRRQILLPSSSILEAVLRQARQQAEQLTYEVLTNGLLPDTLQGLDDLLARRPGQAATWLSWLRNAPQSPAARNILRLIERLAYDRLPRVKITDLLLEVDAWTGFSECFIHRRSGREADDRNALLTVILADGINLGLTRMAETCRGASLRQLAHLHDWHISEAAYGEALGRLIDAHRAMPLAALWGDGTTSSSDGQQFHAGGRGAAIGDINARSGNEPGVAFYTHVSDRYDPFASRVIAATAGEAPYVLDGLLYHQTGLTIEEHYTDTGGASDHVFGLMPFFGYRFAPRLRDIKERRLHLLPGQESGPLLTGMTAEPIALGHVATHWDELLRFATSIRTGTVTASAMLRRLSAYPRQNGLALALRELGRLERSIFMLDWLRDIDLRRRTQAGLNKGEARNALARAIFFNQLGELRDRRFENQTYRASGLNLLVAAIILWNTRYLEMALADIGTPDEIARHIAPLGWEHISLTGDYSWNVDDRP
jgi:TnpA family transposase